LRGLGLFIRQLDVLEEGRGIEIGIRHLFRQGLFHLMHRAVVASFWNFIS
jgi:hypothetical protein